MPGLFGYFHRRGPDREEVERQLSRMVAGLVPRHPGPTVRFVDARFGLYGTFFLDSFQIPSVLPLSQRWQVFLDGFLLNRDELIAYLGAQGIPARAAWDDQTLVRLLYHLEGEKVVFRLHGSFNLSAYDPEEGRLQLLNCRHGARHLYYRVERDFFAFATELKALAVLGEVQVNRLALMDMFNFGYPSGQQTLFAEIYLLAQGRVLTVDGERVEQRQYWDYSYRNTGKKPPFDELVEEGARLLEQAVHRYLVRFERPGVPLSGGLDSRTILALASRYRRPLPVFHCAWYAREERIARELCQQAGGDWHRWDPLEFDPEEMIPEGMELSDGDIHCHQFWFLPMVRQIQSQGLANLLFDGYLMDVFLGDTFLVLPEKEEYSLAEKRAIVNGLWRRCRPIFVKKAFLPTFYREYEEANRASIEGEMARIDEPHLSNFVQRFSLANRSNRYSVALPNLDRQYVEYGYPGLDYDLTDFYLRLPPEYKAGARFYRQILLRHAPEFAAVPWIKTGRPLKVDKGWLSARLGRLPVHQLGTLILLRLSGGRFDLSHRGDLNWRFRQDPRFRRFFADILRDPRTWSRGIIDCQGAERLIALVDRGWPVLTLVQSLVTVELWYRRFVDG